MNELDRGDIVKTVDKEFETMRPQLKKLNQEFQSMQDKDAWGIEATPLEAITTARGFLHSLLNAENTESPESIMNIVLGISPCGTTVDAENIVHPTERALFIFREKILTAIHKEK